MVGKAWPDQKEIREVMIFLQGHGVSAGYATKMFKQYKSQSIVVVKDNPYRLATDIFGIGFITADKIAENLGFAKDSALRAEAGILYVLSQLSDDGHVYYPRERLLEKSCETLGLERAIISEAMSNLAKQKRIVVETLSAETDKTVESEVAVYLHSFHVCEVGIASQLKRLQGAPHSRRKIDAEKAAEWVQKQLSISLAFNQIEAVKSAVNSKVMVITGGPATETRLWKNPKRVRTRSR